MKRLLSFVAALSNMATGCRADSPLEEVQTIYSGLGKSLVLEDMVWGFLREISNVADTIAELKKCAL